MLVTHYGGGEKKKKSRAIFTKPENSDPATLTLYMLQCAGGGGRLQVLMCSAERRLGLIMALLAGAKFNSREKKGHIAEILALGVSSV